MKNSVWLNLSQEELDAAYDQAVYAPNMQTVLSRLSAKSEQARVSLGEPERFQYGPAAIETLDVYTADIPGSPIVIFIHGGSWQVGTAADNAFAAECFVQAGLSFVVPDFSPVDDFNGKLEDMVAQLQQAIIWIYQHAKEFGGDPDRIFLAGFSSGAHLAATLLTTNWEAPGLPKKIFKGALLCSGMYELTPVALSFRRNFLQLDQGNIAALSPQANIRHINCPLLIAYGTDESPEFQRQGNEFIAALEEAGQAVQELVGESLNHFEIIETLGDASSPLSMSFLYLIKHHCT